jgi:hypothetical protein
MNLKEHDYEPVPGLPAPLPEGEQILWQGAPHWASLACRALHARQVAVYFAVLLIWGLAAGAAGGTAAGRLALSSLQLAGLGAAAVGLLTLFGWLMARTTLYTITTRRVVMRIGIALPITIQIPFTRINTAACRLFPDGTGNIALSLSAGERAAYLMLWPHARPWKVGKPEPTLRGIPDAAATAQIIGCALAAAAMQPARTVTLLPPAEPAAAAPIPAAA